MGELGCQGVGEVVSFSRETPECFLENGHGLCRPVVLRKRTGVAHGREWVRLVEFVASLGVFMGELAEFLLFGAQEVVCGGGVDPSLVGVGLGEPGLDILLELGPAPGTREESSPE